ncbi:MAG: hypothetical protein HC886_12665 [Leptolyngbyaceae cyanobacterium SM1_1_3]|nr:hypothetical protein [Leptolyngbyaceae cyanobacterium SM1_1_3]NJN02366.1 hypothetical protein [Leptolyngbyaceae cyanobacterium RM1_1_2]NJO10400.1 hypothetical protein [Leptolyngbyaceae cyanobacterium SL_1_1]
MRGLAKDSATTKTDLGIWFVIALATVLWPVTLPSILCKKAFQRISQAGDTDWVSI